MLTHHTRAPAAEAITHREARAREMAAVAVAVSRAQHALFAGATRDSAQYETCGALLEEALFHLLPLKGMQPEDKALHDLLAAREARRA